MTEQAASVMTPETAVGKVEIYDDVVKTIAGLAASKVDGIFGLKGGFIEGIKQATTGRRDFAAGVEVRRDPGGTFSLDLHIVIKFGVRVPDVAVVVQREVKQQVENITGRRVMAVNVHVDDIRLPDEFTETS